MKNSLSGNSTKSTVQQLLKAKQDMEDANYESAQSIISNLIRTLVSDDLPHRMWSPGAPPSHINEAWLLADGGLTKLPILAFRTAGGEWINTNNTVVEIISRDTITHWQDTEESAHSDTFHPAYSTTKRLINAPWSLSR